MLGLEVSGEADGRGYHYHVTGRQFEIAELKLLVDAIQSSKFITERKSNELIRKLEQFASRYEAQQLNRQVMMAGRVKTMNRSTTTWMPSTPRSMKTDASASST